MEISIRLVLTAKKIALNYKGNSVTYGQLDRNVLAYACYLKNAGLKVGGKVVLSCLNSPEFIYSYFGTVRNGGIIVPINLLLTMEEIMYIVKDSEAKFMIIHPLILQKAKLPREAVEKALGVTLIVLDEEFSKQISEISTEGFEDFTDQDSISTFLYTSGTTGKQKAAMLTHKNLVVNSEQCYIGLQTKPDDTFMCVLPHVPRLRVYRLHPHAALVRRHDHDTGILPAKRGHRNPGEGRYHDLHGRAFHVCGAA